ncbi:hypothetical protein ZOSMA_85G00690 [Zostera marina]|uniref:Uncharacterized protein n=1 Tax=Zostera marina TaxID=29655 RepID=A0A0K9NN42_ZOSMR|nr:hypothetical protein ZOSMA_85G00690 [Zostera marina]
MTIMNGSKNLQTLTNLINSGDQIRQVTDRKPHCSMVSDTVLKKLLLKLKTGDTRNVLRWPEVFRRPNIWGRMR